MLLSVIFVSVYVTEQAYFLQKDFIANINEQATTWKVSHSLLFMLNSKNIIIITNMKRNNIS